MSKSEAPCRPTRSAPSTPKEALDDQLHDFMHTQRNTIRRYFRSCGLFNGNPQMLFWLCREAGLTQRELAQRLHIAAATLSVSVRRMETAGLVLRRPDEKDARVTRLYLTPKGEELDRRCRKGREFLINTLYADFSDDDVQTLSSLLTRMTESLERSWDALPPAEEDETF